MVLKKYTSKNLKPDGYNIVNTESKKNKHRRRRRGSYSISSSEESEVSKLSVSSFKDDSPKESQKKKQKKRRGSYAISASEESEVSRLSVDSLEDTPTNEIGGSILSKQLVEQMHAQQTRSKFADEHSTRKALKTLGVSPKSSHIRQKSIEMGNDAAFQGHYESQLAKHFRSIFLEQKFPRPDLSAADTTICLAGVQALSEILPYIYRPTRYSLVHFFFESLSKDFIRSLTEKEIGNILTESANKEPNPLDPLDSQLKRILERIYEVRDPSFVFTRKLLNIMLNSNIPRKDMAAIIVGLIAPVLTGDEMIQVYKMLPFVIPELIQQLPLQKQDELFFEEQTPEHKALFLKKLGSRANTLKPLIEDMLFSDDVNSQAIPFIASLIKNQVVLADIVFPVSEVEDTLVSERFWSVSAWKGLLQWMLNGPIQPCFVEQCRMDLALADGREESTGHVNLPRLEEKFFPNDLIWMQLQMKTKYPTYFDGTNNPEKRLHARYMYDACVRHIQSAINEVIVAEADIGKVVTEFLFPFVDFSNKHLSPNVELWSSQEVSLWWHQHLPKVCRQFSWIIRECHLTGRDLFHIDESLLQQMDIPREAIGHVLKAIENLKYDKTIRTLKRSPSLNGNEAYAQKSQEHLNADRLDYWTTDDVIKWWKTALPQRCQKHLRAVRECRFEGKDLRVLDDEILSTLGMKKLLRLKVLKALKVLRAVHSPKRVRSETSKRNPGPVTVLQPLNVRASKSKTPRRHSLLPKSRLSIFVMLDAEDDSSQQSFSKEFQCANSSRFSWSSKSPYA